MKIMKNKDLKDLALAELSSSQGFRKLKKSTQEIMVSAYIMGYMSHKIINLQEKILENNIKIESLK